MKLTLDKINYLIADEEKAAREYRRLRLFRLARDESKHRRYLKKLKLKLFGR